MFPFLISGPRCLIAQCTVQETGKIARSIMQFSSNLAQSIMQNAIEGMDLPPYTLQEILAGKVQFPYEEERPLRLFKEYLTSGYYPFFQDTEFSLRLRSVIRQMIEVDIPLFAEMNITSSAKLKKLLYVLAQSVPFKPNYFKLERDLDISRNTLPSYIAYLEKAGLISLLHEKTKGLQLLEKVEKDKTLSSS